MNGNKIVLAILVGALCISAAIYFGGQKSSKVPTVVVPESSLAQTEVTVTPVVASPSALATITVTPSDDLTPIAIAVGKELSVDPATLVVTKSKQIGDYGIGGVTTKGEEAGGGQWWGVKVNGVWKYIFAGQSYPKCSVVAQYQIPKAFLDSCFDDGTNTLKQL